MRKINFRENWVYFTGMLIGLVIVIVGIKFLTDYKMYYGDYRAIAFGGDFYTEIHKATTSAVNTLRNIYEMVRIAIGWSMVGGGLTEVALCGNKLRFHKCEADDGIDNSIEILTEST